MGLGSCLNHPSSLCLHPSAFCLLLWTRLVHSSASAGKNRPRSILQPPHSLQRRPPPAPGQSVDNFLDPQGSFCALVYVCLYPKSQIPNPKSQIPNPKSQIPNPKSQIPNPKSQIPNPKF